VEVLDRVKSLGRADYKPILARCLPEGH